MPEPQEGRRAERDGRVTCPDIERRKQVTMATVLPGWLNDADGGSYPPEPWHLEGTAYVSLWRLPASALPSACLPPGTRPAAVFGQAMVGTAWAVYGPGGDLAYNEVLAAVRVRIRGRHFTTVTHIWVDHPASVAGGRELWGMPKEPAAFRLGGGDGGFEASAATLDGQPIATLRFRNTAALPGRWRFHARTAQRPSDSGRGSGLKFAKAEALASVELGAAAWSFAPGGPLGFLRARTALVDARLAEMSLRFGG